MKIIVRFFIILVFGLQSVVAQFVFTDTQLMYLKSTNNMFTTYRPNQLLVSLGPGFSKRGDFSTMAQLFANINYSPIENVAAEIGVNYSLVGTRAQVSLGTYYRLFESVLSSKLLYVDAYVGSYLTNITKLDLIRYKYNQTFMQGGVHGIYNSIGMSFMYRYNIINVKTVDVYNENIPIKLFDDLRDKDFFFPPEFVLLLKVRMGNTSFSFSNIFAGSHTSNFFNKRATRTLGMTVDLSTWFSKHVRIRESVW